MELTILVENTVLTGTTFQGEAGFSMWIESEGKKILFDTGITDLQIKNASRLGIDLESTDLIALSHGHYDHTGGLAALQPIFQARGRKVPVLLHPTAMEERSNNGKELGFVMDARAFEENYEPRYSKGPVKLTERLTWLGEIPRRYDFENISLGNRDGAPDFLPDDTALVYQGDDGLVVIAGCSHSGICNIVEYAMEYMGDHRIVDIIGGFHLPNPTDEHLAAVCRFLQARHPAALHPCHCTGLRAKIALASILPVAETAVGTVLEY